MDKNDGKEYDLPTWNLITTNDKDNDETEVLIEQSKQSPSAAENIDTVLPPPITALPIVETCTIMVISTAIQKISAKVWTDSFVDVNLHPHHHMKFPDWIKNISPAVKTGETAYFRNHEG